MNSSEPLYQSIVDALLKQRVALDEPVKLAAEIELAQQYGVARTTIRRAMDHLEQQGVVTRRRGRGTYLHPGRVPLKQLRKSVIGFVPPWWADSTQAYYTSTVFDGVCRWIEPRDGSISILQVDRFANDEHELLRQVNRRGLDGLIWVHPDPCQADLLAAVARHVPCVSVGREYPAVGLNSVVPDYAQAASMFDEHLVAQGYNDYSVIGKNFFDPFTMAFVHGFEKARKTRGARLNLNRFVDITPFDREKMAELLLDFHLPNMQFPQALVLTSSSYLQPLLRSKRFCEQMDNGLSVLTFDYGILPMHLYKPGCDFTHVACDWKEVGKQAMNILADLIQRGKDVPRAMRLPVKFVKGQTVFPHKAHAGRGKA